MLKSLNILKRYSLRALDGEIGSLVDFYFDDELWTIRYLVVDTGTWMPGRKVLLAPSMFHLPDPDFMQFHVGLRKEQIRKSPPIDAGQPVSREQEKELRRYFGWPVYWGGFPEVQDFGYAPMPGYLPQAAPPKPAEKKEKGRLRSFNEVLGYRLRVIDGDAGHVEDFLASVKDWIIRYLVIDTRTWLASRQVLIAPQWVEDVSWERSCVYAAISRSMIEKSPTYDASRPLDRKYEKLIHHHYGEKTYWQEEGKKTAA